MAGEHPFLMRIPAEIRMMIYQYLLDNGSSKKISIRNKSRWEYQTNDPNSLRSPYHIMERSFAKRSYETTYCADSDCDRAMHTAIMQINRKIREETSQFLYGRHSFHFGEHIEAVVPFLDDKTPQTRDLVKEMSLYKRSPTNAIEPDSLDWASVCRFMRNSTGLDKLTLVIEGGRPRQPWDGPQSLTVSDFRLLYSTRHESLEWARELASVKSIGEVEIVADIHYLPDPQSNMMLVLAAFSASIETSLVDFLREDLGIPARVGKGTYCALFRSWNWTHYLSLPHYLHTIVTLRLVRAHPSLERQHPAPPQLHPDSAAIVTTIAHCHRRMSTSQ
ncbi:hypothetical protein G7Z17_g10862 [Cylindrodendrum hubeiense]|uniref:DUF7730 domain-containing protein n=1 Tax=Cylindrodendrum hubeiense TaxID=595255 RepID=A0A9P5H6B0_9HYPO|nr:hypothetical protein G7Z17_g10862 [Cylindrodendrum hubeiense]